MEDVDTQDLDDHDEEDMFLCDVCGQQHEILFLDSYLRETFRGRQFHDAGGVASAHSGGKEFTEQDTL
jgi:hypothetical protein